MKTFITIVKIILAVAVITFGCANISKPSNLFVAIGILEIILAIILLYGPLKTLIKQL